METASWLSDTALWVTAAGILVLLFLSAFFSGSETALTAASRGKLHAKADRGEKGARTALDITEDSERLIGAVLLGNNLVNIFAASLATALFTRLFGESGVALATLVMTLLVLVFAEVLPKTYAISNPEATAGRVAPVIRLAIMVFSPVVGAVRVIVNGLLRLFGVRADPNDRVLSVHEEIVGTLSLGHQEGALEKDDRDRIIAALDLKNRTVDEVMLHRSSIEMIDAEAAPDAILEQCLASSHTRLPVFRENPENIVGVVHAREILHAVYRMVRGSDTTPRLEAARMAEFRVMDVATPPYFIPETTSLDDQLREFLRRRSHFALVVDEYGALQGLVTLEDIIEEIVGDISDERDTQAPPVFEAEADGSYLVDGATTIRDINRALDLSLPDEEANTIAGLVIHEAQMIPNEGQVFNLFGFRVEVAEKQANRLSLIRLRALVPGAAEDQA
ncbi:MAG: HlyC/CorC family transporter [Rhodobacteraceae bacterium]|nr:HlyC/CorC family transporter [Paracoccaceae bacterium]